MKNWLNFINICIIKQITTSYPSVFEDSANCLSHTLKKIGINNTISQNTIDPGVPNIIFGVGAGNTIPIKKFKEIAKPNKTIVFNMEQIGSTSSFTNDEYLELLSEYITLDYNQENINATLKITRKSTPGFECPLGPNLFLKTNQTTPKNQGINFDIAFYGAMNEARLRKIEKLKKLGLKIKIINQAYGEFLSDALIDCKAVLNLHYYETHIFESARALRPTAIGIPIISEPSVLPTTIDWLESGVFFTDEDFYADLMMIIKDNDRLTELSRRSLFFSKNEKWLPTADEIIRRTIIELNNL